MKKAIEIPIKLSNNDFMPGVIFCNHFAQGMSYEIGKQLDQRYIYDYELELVTDSDQGSMIQNGQLIAVNKGDIIFRRPGDSTQGVMRYSSYIFCFELIMGTRLIKDYDLMEPKSYHALYTHPMIDKIPRMYRTHHYDHYFAKFKEMLDCYLDPEPFTQNYLSALVVQILYQINQELNHPVYAKHKKSPEIVKALDYIDDHITKELSLEELSHHVHLSPVYFHQVFAKIVGMTPHQYVISKRINMAKEQLIHTTMTIKEITYRIGYKDTSYFCQAFKKETGYTPLNFREKHQITYMN